MQCKRTVGWQGAKKHCLAEGQGRACPCFFRRMAWQAEHFAPLLLARPAPDGDPSVLCDIDSGTAAAVRAGVPSPAARCVLLTPSATASAEPPPSCCCSCCCWSSDAVRAFLELTLPFFALPPPCTKQCHALQCHALQCHALPPPCTKQCHALQCHALQCHALQCHAKQCHALHCLRPAQSSVMHCSD